jgi:hypothetical protein
MILASHVIPVSGTGPLVSISFCRLLSFYCCKFWPVLQGCFCCVISKLEAQHLLFFRSIALSLTMSRRYMGEAVENLFSGSRSQQDAAILGSSFLSSWHPAVFVF